MKKLFGTDGVRGKANLFPMTPEVALSLGQAVALYFSKQKKGSRIIIGKDTRVSSYMFEYALCAGISSMGVRAILTGPLPTPGIAYLTKAMRADAGIVISASHNPFSDNGIKFFDADGFKLPDEVEEQMEEYVFSSKEKPVRPLDADIGRAFRIEDAVGRYVEFLKSTFPKKRDLKGLKIVVDCAHGAAYQVAPILFREMDAEVIPLGAHPNGTNINEHSGALHPEIMAGMVKEVGADLGIALDGDADRLILCDADGTIMDGDQILSILALQWKKKGNLAHDTVVGTVMTNMGLEVFLREKGIRLVRTAVGDRFIMEELRKNGYTLGGEPSGHLILMDLATTGDGILAALQVLAFMLEEGKTLKEMIQDLPLFPQKIKNIPVKEKKDLDSILLLQKALKDTEKKMAGKGRIVLRYSGTESLLRLMVEAETESLVENSIARMESVIRECL